MSLERTSVAREDIGRRRGTSLGRAHRIGGCWGGAPGSLAGEKVIGEKLLCEEEVAKEVAGEVAEEVAWRGLHGGRCWRGHRGSLHVTRVNSTNVLDEGLRIREIGCRMNSKVNSVKQGGYESKRGCRTWLAFNLAYTVLSWPLYIGGQVLRIG
jgi:hypothetical protein